MNELSGEVEINERPIMQREVPEDFYKQYSELRNKAHKNGYWIRGYLCDVIHEGELWSFPQFDVIHDGERTECESIEDAADFLSSLIDSKSL